MNIFELHPEYPAPHCLQDLNIGYIYIHPEVRNIFLAISQHIAAASFKIYLPAGMINPVSSNNGINSIGETNSRPSSVIMEKRISASAPMICSD